MMRFLLSGEGKTDLGQNNGHRFEYGPLCYFIDAVYQEFIGDYSPLYYADSCPEAFESVYQFVDETELCRFAKQLKSDRLKFLPGRKNGPIGLHSYLASALGEKARHEATGSGIVVIPIFFRDSDNPCRKDYGEKLDSIKRGFNAAGYSHRGVPMLALPKSEAWFLCLLDGYRNGTSYEASSGNDNSPNALKIQLSQKLEEKGFGKLSRKALCNLMSSQIEQKMLDLNRMAEQLMSFKDFLGSLRSAMKSQID